MQRCKGGVDLAGNTSHARTADGGDRIANHCAGYLQRTVPLVCLHWTRLPDSVYSHLCHHHRHFLLHTLHTTSAVFDNFCTKLTDSFGAIPLQDLPQRSCMRASLPSLISPKRSNRQSIRHSTPDSRSSRKPDQELVQRINLDHAAKSSSQDSGHIHAAQRRLRRRFCQHARGRSCI